MTSDDMTRIGSCLSATCSVVSDSLDGKVSALADSIDVNLSDVSKHLDVTVHNISNSLDVIVSDMAEHPIVTYSIVCEVSYAPRYYWSEDMSVLWDNEEVMLIDE